MAKAAAANDLLAKLAKAKAAPAAVAPSPAPAPSPPAEEPAPTTPTPDDVPAESAVLTDAPPAVAGEVAAEVAVEPVVADAVVEVAGEPEPEPEPEQSALVELPVESVAQISAEVAQNTSALPVQRTGPAGKLLWRCHTQTQPDGEFEGDTDGDAIAAYREAYGIIGSAHPFVASPLFE